jgi:hypothetical protein
MTFSVNNRFIVEPYIKEALRKEVIGGVATPGQRDGMKGLKTLMPTKLLDGREIPIGSTVYIREETLHSQPWAAKQFTSDTLKTKFIVVDFAYVEFITTPDGDAA